MSDTNAAEQLEKREALVVDLDALDLKTAPESVEVDTSLDAFSGPPPAPDGIHRFKLFPGKEWKLGYTQKTNTAYLSTQIMGKCVAEGESYNNTTTFDFVNTLVFDGKSRMAAIIHLAGGTVPEKVTFEELAKLFRDTLAQEPILKIRGRWKAQEKNPEDGKYVNVQAGMRNFPPLKGPDGNAIPGKYNHMVQGPKSKEVVAAKFEIQEYLADA